MHRFHAQARLVFHFAAEEARGFGHRWIFPEHLLLGVLRLEHHLVQVLEQMGLGIQQARTKLEQQVGKRESLPSQHVPEISQQATACMEAAAAEARRLNAAQIEVGHILLGILRNAEMSSRQSHTVAAGMLSTLEGGLRGVMRRVLDGLRQPTMAIEFEPNTAATPVVAPVPIALLLEASLHQQLLERAQQSAISPEHLVVQWIETQLKQ